MACIVSLDPATFLSSRMVYFRWCCDRTGARANASINVNILECGAASSASDSLSVRRPGFLYEDLCWQKLIWQVSLISNRVTIYRCVNLLQPPYVGSNIIKCMHSQSTGLAARQVVHVDNLPWPLSLLSSNISAVIENVFQIYFASTLIKLTCFTWNWST